MSNLGMKAAVKENKFSVYTMMGIFILLDLFLIPHFFEHQLFDSFFYLVVYEISIIFSLLYGLRGQGRYKEMLIQLQSIARNTDLDINERDARLVSMIHHCCLELGFIYEERNKIYGLDLAIKERHYGIKPFKFKKKTILNNRQKSIKPNKVRIKVQEHTLKNIGRLILAFGLAIIAFLTDFILFDTNFSGIQKTAIIGIMLALWGVGEEQIRLHFKIPKEEQQQPPEEKPQHEQDPPAVDLNIPGPVDPTTKQPMI